MTLKFSSTQIYGSTASIVFASPEQQLNRFQFWRLRGECEVAGSSGGRDVTVSHILHNSYTKYSDLITAITKLESLLLRNGTLSFTSGSGSTLQQLQFANATFDHYDLLPLEGQATPGPLRDLTGTLFKDDGNSDYGWFLAVTMHFRQLIS